jgi:supervillin
MDGSFREHDTGRQRVAFFYWLGAKSSVKEQSLCALALRNRDKERHEHIRVEHGAEPPMFLHLFKGEMITYGSETGIFLVRGSTASLFNAEELYAPIELRSQTAYICLQQSATNGTEVRLFKGEHCSNDILKGTEVLGRKMATIRGAHYTGKVGSIEEMGYTCLRPISWSGPPRLFRIYELEGDEVQCIRFHPQANFSFNQCHLRDCMLVNQHTHLWLWADHVVSTYALKVASNFWSVKYGENHSKTATVICRGREPDAFKALFPSWTPYSENSKPQFADGSVDEESFEPPEPQQLSELLHERTRTRTIKEISERQLPKGCNLKHLEKYLSDEDFSCLFKMTKTEYDSIPRWRQIELKKRAKIF